MIVEAASADCGVAVQVLPITVPAAPVGVVHGVARPGVAALVSCCTIFVSALTPCAASESVGPIPAALMLDPVVGRIGATGGAKATPDSKVGFPAVEIAEMIGAILFACV